MCPSYQATGEEEHSTRGRARLLFEMLDGHGDGPITDGWRSTRGPGRAGPVPGLQGLQDRLPGQRGHGDVQGRVPRPPLPAPAAAARRLRHRLAARAVGQSTAAGGRGWSTPGAVRPCAGSARSWPGWRTATRRCSPDQTLQTWWTAPLAGPAEHAGHARHGAAVAGHLHQLLPPRTSAGPPSRCWRTPAGRSTIPTEPLCCGLTWISTGQLGDRQAAAAAHRRRAGAARAGRRPGGRPRAQLHGGLPLRRRRAVPRRPRRRPAAGPHRHPGRAAHRAHRRLGAPAPRRHRRRWRRCTATSTPCSGGTPTSELLRAAGVDVERLDSGLLRPGRQLRLHRRPRRGQRGLRRAGAAAPGAGRRAGTVVLADGFSCRTQIQQLDSGGQRATTWPSCSPHTRRTVTPTKGRRP